MLLKASILHQKRGCYPYSLLKGAGPVMKKIFRLYVPVIPDNRANPPTLLNTAILQRKLQEAGHDIFNVRANFFLFSSIIAHLRTNWDKTKEKADLSISSLPEFDLF